MSIRLPLGIDDFRKLRTSNCYYVDKTGLIEELLEETFSVNLITRPRRFGKTLTMSMLSEFFDIRKDSRSIFEGLEIAACTKLCEQWMNQWPVLFLTLKDIQGSTFEEAYDLLQFTISSLCMEHDYLEASEKVKNADKIRFSRLLNQNGTSSDLKTALVVLMRMMEAHHGKPVILLVDEYDVPLAKASDHGYYDAMLNIMRSFLGMAWKTNASLQFAVITGCLHIAKESIFTGANNFVSRSISDLWYNRYFGFSEQGTGRADILVKDRQNRRAILIETKRSRTEAHMPKDCQIALKQIRQRQYAGPLLKGYQTVLCYGAAFFEKKCLIKLESEHT